jgi:hypothetical protein
MNEPRQKVSRRQVVAGAGTAGALAAAVAALPGRREIATQADKVPPAPAPNEGGYRETDHVLRYYRTARV